MEVTMYQMQISQVIAFIIFLVFVIISGSILYNLNNVSCQTDAELVKSKTWCKWLIGISIILMGLSLFAFFGLKQVETSTDQILKSFFPKK